VVATGIAVGALLLSGPNAYYTIVALAIYSGLAWIASRSRRYRGLAPAFPAPTEAPPNGSVDGAGAHASPGRAALIAGAATVALGSTAWLTDPAGIQGVLDSFGLWLAGLVAPAVSSPAVYAVGLVGYEPLLVLLAIGDDDYYIMEGIGLEESLPVSELRAMWNETLEPDFARKDYSSACVKFFDALFLRLDGMYGAGLELRP
jgi:hypothetical protein